MLLDGYKISTNLKKNQSNGDLLHLLILKLTIKFTRHSKEKSPPMPTGILPISRSYIGL